VFYSHPICGYVRAVGDEENKVLKRWHEVMKKEETLTLCHKDVFTVGDRLFRLVKATLHVRFRRAFLPSASLLLPLALFQAAIECFT
jgi:hypothetical protein